MSRIRRALFPGPFDALRMRELFIYAIQRNPRPCAPLVDARSGSLSVTAVEALTALFLRFADDEAGGETTSGEARRFLRVADLPATLRAGVKLRLAVSARRWWQRAIAPLLDIQARPPGAVACSASLGVSACSALRVHLASAHIGPDAGRLGPADDVSYHAFFSALSFRLGRDGDGRRQVSEDLIFCAALALSGLPSSGASRYPAHELDAWLGSPREQWFAVPGGPALGTASPGVRWTWSEAGAEAVQRCHAALKGPISDALAAVRSGPPAPILVELFASDLGAQWASLSPAAPLHLVDFLDSCSTRLRTQPRSRLIASALPTPPPILPPRPMHDTGVWSELRWSGFTHRLRAELLETDGAACSVRLTPAAAGALAAIFASVAFAMRGRTLAQAVQFDSLACTLTPSELDTWRATMGFPPVRPALLQHAIRSAARADGGGSESGNTSVGPGVTPPLPSTLDGPQVSSADAARTVTVEVYAIVASHLYVDPARHLRDILVAHGFTDRLFFDPRVRPPTAAAIRAASDREPFVIACGEIVEALDARLADAAGQNGTLQPRTGGTARPTTSSAVYIPQRLLIALAVTLMLVVFFAMLSLAFASLAAARVAALSASIKTLRTSLTSLVAETAQHVLNAASAQVLTAVDWALSQPTVAVAQSQATAAATGVQAAVVGGLAGNALIAAAAAGASGAAESLLGDSSAAVIATTAQLSSLVKQGLTAALASSTLLLSLISGAPSEVAVAANATVTAASAQLLQALNNGQAQLAQRGIGTIAGELGSPPAAVTAIASALDFAFDPSLTIALDAAASAIVPGCIAGVVFGACAVAAAWVLMLRAYVRRIALARRGIYPFKARGVTKASKYIGVQAAQAGVVFICILVLVWLVVVAASAIFAVPPLSAFLVRQAASVLAALVGATLFIAIAEFVVMNFILAFKGTIYFHRLFLVRGYLISS